MQFSEARPGRIFVLRLEDGEIVHEIIERFAVEQNIAAASVLIVGGADDGSRLVVGPREDRGIPLEAMKFEMSNVHEIVGAGTLFRDEEGTPLLHMHMACGRSGQTVTGCIRDGVKVWHVMEAILQELTGTTARRAVEEPLGLKLLRP
jgi:predicted DNA-binding protein with PD1-like motif